MYNVEIGMMRSLEAPWRQRGYKKQRGCAGAAIITRRVQTAA